MPLQIYEQMMKWPNKMCVCVCCELLKMRFSGRETDYLKQ